MRKSLNLQNPIKIVRMLQDSTKQYIEWTLTKVNTLDRLIHLTLEVGNIVVIHATLT
jgi:hypothetical protein